MAFKFFQSFLIWGISRMTSRSERGVGEGCVRKLFNLADFMTSRQLNLPDTAVVAEWSKTLISQIQVENTDP